jgi:alkylation response protein AidB-like acyl-CoA dehydrogenase
MDFHPSEIQRELRELARKILEDQATADRLREIERSERNFDAELWTALARASLLGVAVPAEFGGMGQGFAELAVLIEECGRAVAPVPAIPTLVGAALPIARFGSNAQRAHWLPRVAAGEAILSCGLVEPVAGDPLAPTTRAVSDGAGWRLSGSKLGVAFGAQAERVLVTAAGEGGVGLFLVDPAGAGAHREDLISTAFEPQVLLALDAAPVSAPDVLVAPGAEGSAAARWTIERVQAALAAMQLGVCDRALRMTAAYTATREQFGRKIATFQAVGQRAANAYIDVECLRLVVQHAVWLLAEERPASDEVSIAKIWAGDAGHRVSFAAQHLHGGMGVDVDYPLHRYCLWAKQLELTLGSSIDELDRLGARLARAEEYTR